MSPFRAGVPVPPARVARPADAAVRRGMPSPGLQAPRGRNDTARPGPVLSALSAGAVCAGPGVTGGRPRAGEGAAA